MMNKYSCLVRLLPDLVCYYIPLGAQVGPQQGFPGLDDCLGCMKAGPTILNVLQEWLAATGAK